jgi:GT2 family glycosyltransferase
LEITKEYLEKYINSIEDRRNPGSVPSAAVVVVAYNTNTELIRCLDSLKNQNCQTYEIILVDNGKNEAVKEKLVHYPLLYIALKQNYRPSLARNIGIAYAQAELVCFLDDDAVAHPDYVTQHLRAHEIEGVLGVRGKILPKTYNIYNGVAFHYDLGDEVIPSYVDMENNASFRKDVLIEVGGFDPTIFAGEGAELSFRVVQRFGAPKDLIYWPRAVVYHDFSTGIRKYWRKTVRGSDMHVRLEKRNPHFWSFIESYHPLPIGSIMRAKNLPDRLYLAFLRRLGPWLTACGIAWFRWKYRNTSF